LGGGGWPRRLRGRRERAAAAQRRAGRRDDQRQLWGFQVRQARRGLGRLYGRDQREWQEDDRGGATRGERQSRGDTHLNSVIPAERSESRDPPLGMCGALGPGSTLRAVRDDN